MTRRFHLVPVLLLLAVPAAAAPPAVVVALPTAPGNTHYTGSRAPLRTTPLVMLPAGAVQPGGWLKAQLALMKDGYVGQLPRISRFLQKTNNSWLKPDADDATGWEEVPYWLRGFIELAYLLDDKPMIDEAHHWIEAALRTQAADGYFGPARNRKASGDFDRTVGKPDLWANMVMTDCLISYFDKTGDKRVLDALTKYFKWVALIPEGDFLVPYWQKVRGADLLAQLFWLYDRTGDKTLLDLAHRTHKHTTDWSLGVPDDHNVNVSEAFRGPATYSLLSRDARHLRQSTRGYDAMIEQYGQFPGGGVASDERWRKGYDDPRNMFESCGMVEMMHSHQLMSRFTGNPVWADRCEDVAFNSLPAATTADHKALRYLTAANMVRSDREDRRPELYNGGPMTLMNPYGHRCCQHNTGFGWPYFARNSWHGTADNGLAATLYAPTKVTAKVGNGAEVTVTASTRYPFEDDVALTVKVSKPAKFPLYLRVPGWCSAATVVVAGESAECDNVGGQYVKLDRDWSGTTPVTLTFAAPVRVATWAAQKNNVSVYRGPLAFSVHIPEKAVRVDDSLPKDAEHTAAGDKRLPDFPVWEIHPAGPWNYGLALDPAAPAADIARTPWPDDNQPFRLDACPLALTVPAKRIPGWVLNTLGMPGRVQPSPAKSPEPTEIIRLVPMGAARLRITVLPLVSDAPGAHEWTIPDEAKPTRVTASHCADPVTLRAVTDGVVPANSADPSVLRFTWWDHKGTAEWLERAFESPREVSEVKLYWYDDTGRGECRPPASWRLLYRAGTEWKPVTGAKAFGVERDTFNTVTFDRVKTGALRVEVQLRDKFSAGVLEWQVK